MPRLMEKKDWIRTVANVGSTDRVWYENVVGRKGSLSFSIPESGVYQVILVKLDSKPGPAAPKRRLAHDQIGRGRRLNPLFETLRSCPFGGVELNVERDHTTGREVEFA